VQGLKKNGQGFEPPFPVFNPGKHSFRLHKKSLKLLELHMPSKIDSIALTLMEPHLHVQKLHAICIKWDIMKLEKF
jgi:hypothetical protein